MTLTAFLRQAAFRERHIIRTISSGKSAQFPATGLLFTQTHTPGQEIVGQIMNNAEKVINIEGMIIAPGFIASIDQLMNHYDYAAIFAEQIAQALSKKYDIDVSRVIALAARITAATVKGVYPNDTLTSTEVNPLFATDGPTIVNGVYDAAVVLDQRDVPMDDRYVTFRPLQYALAVKDERALDVRFNEMAKDLGSFSQNTLKAIAGIPVVKTNNLVNSNDVGNALEPTQRQHDFSVTQGLIFHKSAAGTVSLSDVAMETWWDPLRQGNHMLGKYVCGHDILRPEAAYELQSAAPAG